MTSVIHLLRVVHRISQPKRYNSENGGTHETVRKGGIEDSERKTTAEDTMVAAQ